MDGKYFFIKQRLTELGKTQTELAETMGILQSKLNVTLNKPEQREFQMAEIADAAEFLQYDLGDFVRYVSEKTKNLPREDGRPHSTIDRDRMSRILSSVNFALNDMKRTMPEDKKMEMVFYLYDEGRGKETDGIANDNEEIKTLLKFAMAGGM